MWRVFPYAEECLSLLRTFSCCHPVVMLCVLGKRITVGFEDPESATYGLVQFGLGDKMRCDHRPQDDPMDHITGEPGTEQRRSPCPYSQLLPNLSPAPRPVLLPHP